MTWLQTSEQIEYSGGASAVNLPTLNESTSVAPNVEVVATGFGERNKTDWWRMRFVNFSVITNSECLETFNNVGNSTMCAKNTEGHIRGSLCGEYGAPLVRNEPNQTFVGLYQASTGTCTEGKPERFVNIGSFIPWIIETARFATLEPDIYWRYETIINKVNSTVL